MQTTLVHAKMCRKAVTNTLHTLLKSVAHALPCSVQACLGHQSWHPVFFPSAQFYETLVPAPQGEGMDAARTEDFSSALAAELKSLKSGEKQQFQVWNTGIPGSVYIKFDSDYGKPGHDQLRLIYC
ncbi:unnamed protein product [Ostreobium quekettii]|uniref:Uncharacterized protein n=1 Tax=Ostreobium quekettii TaxID=121088 RepID=A0A8S1IYV4_9CHLO|nr:unnamed protein product [Ostreobium quekettii]